MRFLGTIKVEDYQGLMSQKKLGEIKSAVLSSSLSSGILFCSK